MKKIADNVSLVVWGLIFGVFGYMVITQDQSPEAADYMAKAMALKATSIAVAK